VLGNDLRGAMCFERQVTPPFGQAGGRPGSTAKLWIELPDGTRRTLAGKGAFAAPAGSLVTVEAPGSGGYGSPSYRDPRALEDDLLDGYVSAEGAAREYGKE
jgi:N-methylhydantoinase B